MILARGAKLDLVCRNCDFGMECEGSSNDGYVNYRCCGCGSRIAVKQELELVEVEIAVNDYSG